MKQLILTKLVYLVLGILTIAGCTKDDANKQFILRGQLLDNCTGLPVSSVKLDLWQNLIKGTTVFDPDEPAYLISSTTTDNNGNFEFKGEFDTKNSSNFPRDGSIQLASVGMGTIILATGWLEIESGKSDLDLGVLYKDIDKTLPFVFMNDGNFEIGDKIIVSKPNDLFSFDTISVTVTSSQFVINRQAHFTTKNINYGTVASQSAYTGLINVGWDFINNPDKSKLFSISTATCTSQDSIYLKWW